MEGRVFNLIAGGASVFGDGFKGDFVSRGNVKKERKLLVGDMVEVDVDLKVITEIKPRKNELVRPAVANVDQIVICLSSLPKADLTLVDKMVALALSKNIMPIICITKTDITDSNFIAETKQQYSPIGVKILSVSAKQNEGVNEIMALLRGKISVFAGQSGVGKSTLINALNSSLKIKTGELTVYGRGKNTTTANQIYDFDDSLIIDTAGFSALSLGGVSPEKLTELYPDIYGFARECRYKSCSHYQKTADECGVINAIEQNRLSKARFDRYLIEYLKATDRYKIYDRKTKRKGKKNV